MAIDKKYGKVTTEFGDIGDDEPIIVFRARDVLVASVLRHYAYQCMKARVTRKHIDIVMDRVEEMLAWQQVHPELVRLPASKGYFERIGSLSE